MCVSSGHRGKEYTCRCRRCKRCGLEPWAGTSPWSRKWQPTPVFLPGNFHGKRSLASYSPSVFKNWTQLSLASYSPSVFKSWTQLSPRLLAVLLAYFIIFFLQCSCCWQNTNADLKCTRCLRMKIFLKNLFQDNYTDNVTFSLLFINVK